MKSVLSILGASVLALTLAACGGSDEPDADVPPAVNGEVDHVDDDGNVAQDVNHDADDDDMAGGDQPMNSAGTDPEFVAGCLQSSNMSREMCTCLAASARAELSDNGHDFLVATLNQRADEATAIRMRMSIEEVTQSAMFMTNGTRDCAERGFNQ